MVEQGNHNPLVGGSNPSAATSRPRRSCAWTRPPSPSKTSVPLRAAAIAGAVERTPTRHSRTLSEIAGCEIWLKFENLQFTASFKDRGALNKLLSLTPEERTRGVVAMSAGNHAQGVAYHAGRLGIPATIVMPLGNALQQGQAHEGLRRARRDRRRDADGIVGAGPRPSRQRKNSSSCIPMTIPK